jgi:hypothetical protein
MEEAGYINCIRILDGAPPKVSKNELPFHKVSTKELPLRENVIEEKNVTEQKLREFDRRETKIICSLMLTIPMP